MKAGRLILTALLISVVSLGTFAQSDSKTGKSNEQSSVSPKAQNAPLVKNRKVIARKRQPASIGNPFGMGGSVTVGKRKHVRHARAGKIKP